MGTRNLAAVPSPPGRSAPRTYEEIVRAIYNDKRASHEVRELLLAVAYAVYLTDPEQGVSPLREARRVLGRNRIGKPRYMRNTIAASANSESHQSGGQSENTPERNAGVSE